MNWDAIGAIGEILGAIVVVVSVIYLASQVRQNTAAARADALRSFSIEVSNQFMEWGKDERLSELWLKIYHEGASRKDLSGSDMMSISFMVISRLNILNAAYRSFREGILTENEFEQMLSTRVWELPFVHDSWSFYKKELSGDFIDYMERKLPQLREAVKEQA
jgi:hypothetical protein